MRSAPSTLPSLPYTQPPYNQPIQRPPLLSLPTQSSTQLSYLRTIDNSKIPQPHLNNELLTYPRTPHGGKWVNEIVVNASYSFAGVSYKAVVETIGKLTHEFGALVEVPPGINK
jgi:hypothetical protein